MIPARMGSKRIPKKNIRYLDNKPLIQYPIDLAQNCSYINEIWINSESDILGDYAQGAGVKFHKRPMELGSDTATNVDFTAEFLKKHDCDYVVMINPTSPLLRDGTVDKFCQYIEENDCDTIMSIVNDKAESFYLDKPINFSLKEKINSQELEGVKKIVWALTAWKKEHFLKIFDDGQCPVFSGVIGLFEVPKDESCDLDTPEDWAIAEGMIVSRRIKDEKAKYWMETER